MHVQVQCKFNMPEGLHALLKATAALERRSLSQQVILMLENALRERTIGGVELGCNRC